MIWTSLWVVLLSLVTVTQANEWKTSRGQHCIERCELKKKWEGEDAYACYTVDGHNKEFRSGNRFAGSKPPIHNVPALDDDDFPWDYCIPAVIPKDDDKEDIHHDINLHPDQTENQGGFHDGNDNGGGGYHDESDNGGGGFHDGSDNGGGGYHDGSDNGGGGYHDGSDNGGGGYHDGSDNDGSSNGSGGENGGSGFNPGKVDKSSLPGKDCIEPCKMSNENHNHNHNHTCKIDESKSFYCSPDIPLKREQISSHNKMWCIDDCAEDNKCKTLLGRDDCSRKRNESSKGTPCLSKCQIWPENPQMYSCKISDDNFENCGNWDVESYVTHKLEYTQDGKVCASPCMDHDGVKLCSYVEWKLNDSETDPVSTLYMMEGECGPEEDTNWTLISIILGSIVAAIILISFVGMMVSKKKYERTSTIDHP